MYSHVMRIGLQFGSKHKLNAILKRLLNEVMNPSPDLIVNEVFDKELSAASLKFKYLHKIEPVSSTADLKTWAKIGELLGERRTREEAKLDREVGKLLSGELIAPPYTPEMAACDKKLAEIFGGKDAVAAGSGFEPKNMPGKKGMYRGKGFGDAHLDTRMHLYGSEDGLQATTLYIPGGGTYIGPNPYSKEDSYMFYYEELGKVKNVTLFVSHVANFIRPKLNTKFTARTRIGDIGGKGGRSKEYINSPDTYIHSHLAIHKGRGYNENNRLSFADVVCR